MRVSRKLEEIYKLQLFDILDASKFLLSDVRPSEWTEQNRVMNSDETPVPGALTYS